MRIGLYAIAGVLLLRSTAAGVMIGQIQTFDNSDNPWTQGGGLGGAPATALPLALGGPGGPLDQYLLIESSGGSGPGSRITAQNFNLWAGDYIAAGIGRIRMDVNNFSSGNDLVLRLLFVDFVGPAPENVALTDSVTVPAGSGWQSIEFDISPASLITVLGSPAAALASTDELRIVHNPGTTFIPGEIPAIAGTLGVDNLNAVPEPGSAVLLLSGLLAAYGFRNSAVGRARRVKRD